jgi:hypothetical protein
VTFWFRSFLIFPTAETLVAQFLAVFVVVGSYFLARRKTSSLPEQIAV